MPKGSRFLCAVLASIILMAGCQKPPETAESVLQKVIASHAKDDALAHVDGLLYHGHVQALTGEQHGKLWILFRQPEKLRVVVEMENAKEDRLYLDGLGWRDDGKGFVPATDLDYDLMKFQTEHLTLPLGLKKRKYEVRLAEKIVANEPVRLTLIDKDGIETKITIDPVRWVIRTAERAVEIKGQTALLGVVYEEYRTIKGVQLPYRILNFINGQPVGRTDFTSIQINPSIPENIFSAPGR